MSWSRSRCEVCGGELKHREIMEYAKASRRRSYRNPVSGGTVHDTAYRCPSCHSEAYLRPLSHRKTPSVRAEPILRYCACPVTAKRVRNRWGESDLSVQARADRGTVRQTEPSSSNSIRRCEGQAATRRYL